jgi:hypothetical protein
MRQEGLLLLLLTITTATCLLPASNWGYKYARQARSSSISDLPSTSPDLPPNKLPGSPPNYLVLILILYRNRGLLSACAQSELCAPRPGSFRALSFFFSPLAARWDSSSYRLNKRASQGGRRRKQAKEKGKRGIGTTRRPGGRMPMFALVSRLPMFNSSVVGGSGCP